MILLKDVGGGAVVKGLHQEAVASVEEVRSE